MADALLDDIRRRLVQDPDWRRFIGDGSAWVCRCCATTVEASQGTLSSLITAIRDHLELACPAWHAGGPWPAADILRKQHDEAELSFRLAHDPSFQVIGEDGGWTCPGCLHQLPKATELYKNVLAHRGTCEPLAAWRIQPLAKIASAHGQPAASVAAAAANAPTVSETERELDQARSLQLNLMRHPPALPGFHVATHYQACTELSGDFNQFVHLPDGRMAFAQGDVSGHGVRAGMFMAMANKLVELFGSQGLDPRQTVVQVHRAMVDDLVSSSSFITMVYAVLDPGTLSVTWVRAGHNPVLVWRAGTGEIETLTPSGMAVGFPVQDLFLNGLEVERTQLMPGDLFLIFTDGITEAMGPGDEQFGDERLIEVIKSRAAQGPGAVVDSVVSSVTSHLRGRAPQDDHSLIVIGVDG